MSSQYNRDRSSITLRLAVAASLMFAGVAAQGAEQAVIRPVLTGYTDTVGSNALVAGQYETLIAEVSRFKDAPNASPTAYNTNLCVGYIVTRQMEAAGKACNAAVRAAKRERAQLASWMISSRKEFNEQVAIAYSNRAVMHWVSSNTASAAQDLAKAQALSPSAMFVTRNQAAFETKSALAQATTTK